MCVGYAHKSIKSIEAPPLFEHRQKGAAEGHTEEADRREKGGVGY